MQVGIKFLDLRRQYESIKPEIDRAISGVIEESAFVGGRHVASFENNFAKYQAATYCIGVGNGTDALEIVLEALHLPRGSEIIVPANSFIATSEAVTRAGLKVVFCACDPNTYTMDVADFRAKITPATSAVIPVHLYGHACDMDGVLATSREHGLKVIEDCAQAHGADYRGRRVGTLGVAGTFSFYPGKNLGAYGDAGAIVVNDGELAARCRMISNHGRVAKYDHEFEGRNSRLDGLQAAILDVKLAYIESWIERRRQVAAEYDRLLADVAEIIRPIAAPWARHVYHLYVIRTHHRDELRRYLSESGIETGVHYPIALTRLSAYACLGQATASDGLHDQFLSLPIGEHLGASDVWQVCDATKTFFASKRISV